MQDYQQTYPLHLLTNRANKDLNHFPFKQPVMKVSNLVANWSRPFRLHYFRILEAVRLFFVAPKQSCCFHIVSCERNSGQAAIKCLDSVYTQHYPRHLVRHVFIDDASSDDTHNMILEWLHDNPDHNVDYIRNNKHRGGCANNLTGFRMAPSGSILLELNGDDWLPDPGVLKYLNKFYNNPNVWMTYNTLKTSEGRLIKPFPIPKHVIETNTFRENNAYGRALHSFRQELFLYLKKESLIDTETGDFFASGDDKAFYFSLQELAGTHARHLYRTTYVYNFDGYALDYGTTEEQEARTQRIRQIQKCEPLETLHPIVKP